MKRFLVINADDGGLHPDTDAAILMCARAGSVSSVSVVPNGPTAPGFIHQAQQQGLGIGLHLNLTEGSATVPIEGLTDSVGCFPINKETAWRRLDRGDVDANALGQEIRHQWNTLANMLGEDPDHIDGHNHIQIFRCVQAQLHGLLENTNPDIYIRNPRELIARPEIMKCLPDRLARSHTMTVGKGVPLFVGHGFSHCAAWTSLVDLKETDHSCAEWMVHPGSRKGSQFTASDERDAETRFLCDPELPLQLKKLGWTIGRFGDCSCESR